MSDSQAGEVGKGYNAGTLSLRARFYPGNLQFHCNVFFKCILRFNIHDIQVVRGNINLYHFSLSKKYPPCYHSFYLTKVGVPSLLTNAKNGEFLRSLCTMKYVINDIKFKRSVSFLNFKLLNFLFQVWL